MKLVPKGDLQALPSFMPLWRRSCKSFSTELQPLAIIWLGRCWRVRALLSLLGDHTAFGR